MSHLSGLKWWGGKATRHQWINHHLPASARTQLYVEPFAGMLSVLLNRPKAGLELVNDLNGRLVNWWRVVRDEPAALADRLFDTPWSRELYIEALVHLDVGAPLDRAWNFTIAVSHSILCSDGRNTQGSFHWHERLDGCSDHNIMRHPEGIRRLADRMRNVQIECGSGVEVVRRAALKAARFDTVLYVDPPYAETDRAPYGDGRNIAGLQDSLLEAAAAGAKVAVSGYPGNFELPGWRRETRKDLARLVARERTECIWLSYPEERSTLFDMEARNEEENGA